MEIINPFDRVGRDIKAPLRSLTADPNPLTALRGRLLLEVVRRLEGCPGPRVWAHAFMGALSLCAGSRETDPVVQVDVDWQDYGPIRDGLPVAHFRVHVKRPGVVLSEETRTADADEAVNCIVQGLTEERG